MRMRVVVADDSVLLREGVVRLLEEEGFEVVGQAGDADELMRKVAAHEPDVAVVDIRMPPTNTDDGLRAAREIGRRHPDTGVLVLSQYVDQSYAVDLVADVAGGVLTAREREVLELVAEGRSNHAIAGHLVITERAVEKHVTRIFSKLGLEPAPGDHRSGSLPQPPAVLPLGRGGGAR